MTVGASRATLRDITPDGPAHAARGAARDAGDLRPRRLPHPEADPGRCAVPVPLGEGVTDGLSLTEAAVSPRVDTLDLNPAFCPDAPICLPGGRRRGGVARRPPRHRPLRREPSRAGVADPAGQRRPRLSGSSPAGVGDGTVVRVRRCKMPCTSSPSSSRRPTTTGRPWCATTPKRRTASSHRVIDAGVSPADALAGIVVHTQQKIGDSWAANHWTVGQEHAATAISEEVVTRVGDLLPAPDPERALLLVACAEREFHSLAAQVVAVSMRSWGWPTDYLGPDTRRDRLQERIRSGRPAAVLVSASLSSSPDPGRAPDRRRHHHRHAGHRRAARRSTRAGSGRAGWAPARTPTRPRRPARCSSGCPTS